MHLQPVYQGFAGTLNGSAETLFSSGLTLPSGSGLGAETFESIEHAITDAVAAL
jgi:hypothetical protein